MVDNIFVSKYALSKQASKQAIILSFFPRAVCSRYIGARV